MGFSHSICIVESMKAAVVLAGNHETTENRYEAVLREFRSNGWENVMLYGPNWQATTIKQLVNDFIERLPTNREPLTLLGFSLGAMIALIAASRITVDNLVLCSPSGYFVEYDSLLSKDDRGWANRSLKDFRDFSATDVLSSTRAARGIIIAGQTELEDWPDFRKWITDLKSWTNWQYIEVPNTGHEIEASRYQDTIKKTIKTIT